MARPCAHIRAFPYTKRKHKSKAKATLQSGFCFVKRLFKVKKAMFLLSSLWIAALQSESRFEKSLSLCCYVFASCMGRPLCVVWRLYAHRAIKGNIKMIHMNHMVVSQRPRGAMYIVWYCHHDHRVSNVELARYGTSMYLWVLQSEVLLIYLVCKPYLNCNI